MLNESKWCSLCNANPADGELTLLIDEEAVCLPACLQCVNDKEKVIFDD